MTVMRPENERRGGVLNIEIKKFPGTGYPGTSPVEAETGKDYWKITIEDTGIGIDKQTMEKIFEPFFTTKAKGRGTGLGLAMVYNITHMHNGFINVDSEPGRGSSFSLFIPVDESGAVQREELQCHLKAGSGRILVIDDEESICETSRELLDYCGYEVTVECNPELALKRYSEAKIAFDCVILDLNMPKKNGFEVLLHLKAEFPDSKIIISSGSIGDEKIKTLSAAGAVAFITKPYTLESLAKTVADVIASV
jgi:CheY-like chemotaxis protein